MAFTLTACFPGKARSNFVNHCLEAGKLPREEPLLHNPGQLWNLDTHRFPQVIYLFLKRLGCKCQGKGPIGPTSLI